MKDLVGIGEGGPIEPFVPMMMFAIVFGLSMDYEVFLLSRIKEEYDRTGDNARAVADGLAKTARVITAAAAIMVVVFAAFLLEDDRVIKLFGVGLASAVLLDATVVRMLPSRRRWSSWATATGGCPAGSTGSCPRSTSRAPPTPNRSQSPKRSSRLASR
jgi:predicted RND superfamily exporter protein